MSKTRDEVVDQAAKFNKLIDASGTFEAADEAAIDNYFEPLIAQLRVDEICDVTDEDEILDEWFMAIGGLLANMSGPEFGIEYNPQKKMVLEAELRRMVSGRPTYEVQKAEYF